MLAINRLYVVLFCLLISACLSAQIIEFSNETLYKEFDEYAYSVVKYNDQLITRNRGSIQEYLITNDGSLHMVAIFERSALHPHYTYVDNNRFYDVAILDEMRGLRIEVYNLLHSPMQKITDFEIIFSSNMFRLHFSQNYIIVYDVYESLYLLFNKNNYQFERTLSLPSSLVFIDDNFLVIQDEFTIQFYSLLDENEFQLEYLSEISVSFPPNFVFNCVKQDDFLVILHAFGTTIIDIRDLQTPSLWIHIPTEGVPLSTIVSNDLIVSNNGSGYLEIFQRYDVNDFELVYQSIERSYMWNNNMYINYPYLYINQGFALNVYNLSNNFTLDFTYGDNSFDYAVIPAHNTLYMFHVIRSNDQDGQPLYKYEFIDVLKNELFLQFEFINHTANVVDIKENLLFMFNTNLLDNTRCFEVYNIENEQIDLLHSLPVNTLINNYNVIGTNVFLRSYDQSLVEVYQLRPNEFIYLGSFLGRLQSRNSEIHASHFLALQNNQVLVRDVYDFDLQLAGYTLPNWGFNEPVYYDDANFLLFDQDPGRFRAYNHNIDQGLWSEIYSFPAPARINTHNQIITLNAYGSTQISEYFSIINGIVHKLGEKEDNRFVNRTYFYPEQKKMIQSAQSGIWIYDFDYTVSDTDTTIEPAKAKLLKNFPNPFNPETTISFYLPLETQVSIDIYNIKGQKVKSLIKEIRTSGNHQVNWNGTDEDGHDVSSGIYLYTLSTSDFFQSKKMIILR